MIFIVSPHIDDAILSMGGLIYKMGKRKLPIRIQYLFSISNWTNPDSLNNFNYGSGINEISDLRKCEEHSVNKKLRYEYFFSDFYDLPLRQINECTSAVDKKQLKDHIRSLVNADDLIFFPVGIDHPDHIITGNSGLSLLEEGFRVILYEDLPYFGRPKNDCLLIHNKLLDNGFRPQVINLDIKQKIRMIRMYKSQVSPDWLRDIINYSYSISDKMFYERFWIHNSLNVEFPSA